VTGSKPEQHKLRERLDDAEALLNGWANTVRGVGFDWRVFLGDD